MTRIMPLVQRRLAVLVQLLSFPIFIFVGYWLPVPIAFVAVVGLTIGVGASFYLYWGTGLWQYGNAPDEQLDERQAQIRNYAYRLAYMIASTLLLSLLFYLLVGIDFGRPRLTGYATFNILFWAAMLLSLTLPSAILAWIESDI